ncbi:unnamed protein product [Blepharisma stoltei]|uniref:Uncharacterized protein n=1 Tax=Blepharisma stoltei TaxID=1481888 RepID=A0AAU9ILB8_9CILI|nr:unnamed protein product [Blepharisma stoltei]
MYKKIDLFPSLIPDVQSITPPRKADFSLPPLKFSKNQEKPSPNASPLRIDPKYQLKISAISSSQVSPVPIQNVDFSKSKRKAKNKFSFIKKAEEVMSPFPPPLEILNAKLQNKLKCSRLLDITVAFPVKQNKKEYIRINRNQSLTPHGKLARSPTHFDSPKQSTYPEQIKQAFRPKLIQRIIPLELSLPPDKIGLRYVNTNYKDVSRAKRSKSELVSYLKRKPLKHHKVKENNIISDSELSQNSSRKIVLNKRSKNQQAITLDHDYELSAHDKHSFDVACYVKELSSTESSKSIISILPSAFQNSTQILTLT